MARSFMAKKIVMAKKGQLKTIDEAVPAKKQHRGPCADCPFSREALPGWLGGGEPEAWMAAARGEERLDCHTLSGAQCAGAAIFRANICKSPRDPEILRLPRDTRSVFKNHDEFMDHHDRGERDEDY